MRPLIVMAKSGQRFANWRDCCRLWIGATEEPFRLFLNWLYREREDGRYLVRSDDVRPSMRRLGVSRRDLFLELDRSALKELPAEPASTPNGACAGLVSIYHVSEMLACSLVGCLALIEQSSQVRTEFAADSLLEGDGFEPSVPRSRSGDFRFPKVDRV